MDTRIYVCTHKKAEKPPDEIYQFIHAGHQISPDLGYIGDDTKDHISYKNKSFCELTAIYWIYKNISCDIVGICHYRRYFIENENFLCKERIEQLLEKYDIILPNSLMHPNSNTEAWYGERHHAKDLQIIKDIIDEKYPDEPDYDLIDHLIFIACKEIPGTEEIISSCPASNPHYLDLTACLNNVRKKNQELADLFPDTFLFKLSHKIELRKENLVGQKTFYGYL